MFFYYINVIIAVYSGLLIVCGTIGNFLSIVMCFQKQMRSIPTFVFYIFVLFTDTIGLYIWNLDHIIYVTQGKLMEDTSVEICRFLTVLQCVALQWSAWLLVKLIMIFYLNSYD